MEEGARIEDIDNWIAKLGNRDFDWDALGFQAEVHPK